MKSKEIAADLSESARDRKEDYGLGKGFSDFPGSERCICLRRLSFNLVVFSMDLLHVAPDHLDHRCRSNLRSGQQFGVVLFFPFFLAEISPLIDFIFCRFCVLSI
ncbi:hypothetical protein F2Q68_00042934 [Brassica cretica]|uniref:Uncharacterized protein n=1 Tax=Brassica cretica TaxID=69181 RepID=A0A8S9LMK8_BRACR|nr:hypothetical protein F2Q68_00042934 [Brassica cretica]